MPWIVMDKRHFIWLHGGVRVRRRIYNFKLTNKHQSNHSGKENVVYLLIQNGADVNALAHSGKTALHLAAIHGKFELIFEISLN